MPNDPISNSLACVVVAVKPELALPLLPAAVAALSNHPDAMMPRTWKACPNLRWTLGCVIVIVSPVVRAAVTGAEKIIVRIPVPFVTISASFV